MKNILWSVCIAANLFAGEWVMFSDCKDTYIYSQNSGEIYIRHHLGKKNYEDIFVKMPRGMLPNEINKNQAATAPTTPMAPTKPNTNALKDFQLEALKKSQEILHSAIE